MVRIVKSGGARGADTAWKQYFDDKPVDFMVVITLKDSMPIHHDTKGVLIQELSAQDNITALSHVNQAKVNMGMRPGNSANHYLLRDFYQINNVEAVFAVGKLNPERTGLGVDGGTGFTCQMHHDLHQNNNVFLYEVNKQMWIRYVDGVWIEQVPNIDYFWSAACIGTRDFQGNIEQLI